MSTTMAKSGGAVLFSLLMTLFGALVLPPYVFAAESGNGPSYDIVDPNLVVSNLRSDSMVAYRDKFYFAADDGVHGKELWVSDGSAAGTAMVADFAPDSASSIPDASTSPTSTRSDVSLTVVQDQIFYACTPPGLGVEVCSFDPATGTITAIDVNPAAANSEPHSFTRAGSRALFAANRDGESWEWWVSDGTTAGTWMASDQPGTASGAPDRPTDLFVEVAGNRKRAYFVEKSGSFGGALYEITDANTPATGPTPVRGWRSTRHPDRHILDAEELVAGRDEIYFAGFDTDHGFEVWRSDGTGHAKRFADYFPGRDGSYPRSIHVVKGGVFFWGEDADHGREMAFTDGTARGTRLVLDVVSGEQGSTGPRAAHAIGGELYFTLNSQDRYNGGEVWVSDGTPGGTLVVKDLVPGADGAGFQPLFSHQKRMYFLAPHAPTVPNSAPLFVTDGTGWGTRRLAGNPFSSRPSAYAFMPEGNIFMAANSNTNLQRLRRMDLDSRLLNPKANAPKKATLKKAGARVKIAASAGETYAATTKGTLVYRRGNSVKKMYPPAVTTRSEGGWSSKKIALKKKHFKAVRSSTGGRATLKVKITITDLYGNSRVLQKAVQLRTR